MYRSAKAQTSPLHNHKTFLATSAIALTLIAGAPLAMGSPEHRDAQARHMMQDRENHSIDLRTGTELINTDLRNRDGDTLGTIENFIVDRVGRC